MTAKKLYLVKGSFLQKKDFMKELLEIIKNHQNPYPPDIFTWDNKELITDERGKYNKLFFSIVENTKDDIAKEIIDFELEMHKKVNSTEITPSELEHIKGILKNNLIRIKGTNEPIYVKTLKECIILNKQLLKKLEGLE